MNTLDIPATIFSIIFTTSIILIGIAIEITILKYLIRYGIDYFFAKKIMHDGQKEIEDIQIDMMKDRP